MTDIDELRRLLAALTPEQIRAGLARLDTPERRRELDQRLAPYRASRVTRSHDTGRG